MANYNGIALSPSDKKLCSTSAILSKRRRDEFEDLLGGKLSLVCVISLIFSLKVLKQEILISHFIATIAKMSLLPQRISRTSFIS